MKLLGWPGGNNSNVTKGRTMKLTTAKLDMITVWKALEATGLSKEDVLPMLYRAGEISQRIYINDCPLCEYSYRATSSGYKKCTACPLPGEGRARCLKMKVRDWQKAVGYFERRKAAAACVDELMGLLFGNNC